MFENYVIVYINIFKTSYGSIFFKYQYKFIFAHNDELIMKFAVFILEYFQKLSRNTYLLEN